MSTKGLVLRIARLEQARPPAPRRLVPFFAACQRPGESQEEALRRHGLAPGRGERLVMHRYGGPCPQCREEARGD